MTYYETKISDKRWYAYDIPGNIGWIAYIVSAVKNFKEKQDVHSIVGLIPGILMLIGVAELISERIAGLDRMLSRIRLWRGFGALTVGGIAGIPVSIMFLKKNRKRSGIMLAGSVLCAVFAGLLLKGYKKK